MLTTTCRLGLFLIIMSIIKKKSMVVNKSFLSFQSQAIIMCGVAGIIGPNQADDERVVKICLVSLSTEDLTTQ